MSKFIHHVLVFFITGTLLTVHAIMNNTIGGTDEAIMLHSIGVNALVVCAGMLLVGFHGARKKRMNAFGRLEAQQGQMAGVLIIAAAVLTLDSHLWPLMLIGLALVALVMYQFHTERITADFHNSMDLAFVPVAAALMFCSATIWLEYDHGNGSLPVVALVTGCGLSSGLILAVLFMNDAQRHFARQSSHSLCSSPQSPSPSSDGYRPGNNVDVSA